jgi:hypothetical protein
MSFITIKDKLITKLQGISDIQAVEEYPTIDFNGYPAAVVRTDGNNSQYETNTENDELYTFTIYLLEELQSGLLGEKKARRIIEELCDTVRDNIDSDEFLSGISMPSGRVMLGVRPTVSKIFVSENGKFVTAEIEVVVRVSKSV